MRSSETRTGHLFGGHDAPIDVGGVRVRDGLAIVRTFLLGHLPLWVQRDGPPAWHPATGGALGRGELEMDEPPQGRQELLSLQTGDLVVEEGNVSAARVAKPALNLTDQHGEWHSRRGCNAEGELAQDVGDARELRRQALQALSGVQDAYLRDAHGHLHGEGPARHHLHARGILAAHELVEVLHLQDRRAEFLQQDGDAVPGLAVLREHLIHADPEAVAPATHLHRRPARLRIPVEDQEA